MNILYTTEAVVEGGRAGHGRTSDGRLLVELSVPKVIRRRGRTRHQFRAAFRDRLRHLLPLRAAVSGLGSEARLATSPAPRSDLAHS